MTPPPTNVIDDVNTLFVSIIAISLTGIRSFGSDVLDQSTQPVRQRPTMHGSARIDVSASFFLSIEFQQTGYLVVSASYKVAYGDADRISTLPANHQLAVPIVRFE